MRGTFPTLACALVVAASWPRAAVSASSPPSAPLQFDSLWRQSTAADFRSWRPNGAGTADPRSSAGLRLHPRSTTTLVCAQGDIDGGDARYDSRAGLCRGDDPRPAEGYYNGGSFFYGTAVSPIHRPGDPINRLIASWNAETPAGTWLEIHVRVLEGARWSAWYSLGVWASGTSTIRRHSVNHQGSAGGAVDTDTFRTPSGRATPAYQVSVTLFTARATVSPAIHSIAVIASRDTTRYAAILADRSVWGTDLPVPPRSQMLARYRALGYGGGGEVWCSPTSISMVMAYWAGILHRPELIRTVPQAARGTYDWAYGGTGNWPFNVAYAVRSGLTGYVTRLQSMSQVEQWIKARVPIVLSIAYRRGELPGSTFPASAGHLLVVRGFTSAGDVITNDPGASSDARGRMVYPRAALERVWLASTHGTVYVLYPPGWSVPAKDSRGSW